MEQLLLAGMNVARLNFAHGTLQGHREDIRRIHAVAARTERSCLIMADLPGIKIRIGKLPDEPLVLEKGDEVILTVKDLVGTANRIPVGYKRLPESVNPGSLIFLNDGFIQLQVEKVSGEEVFCRTVIGGPLLSYKGLDLPGVKILAERERKAVRAMADLLAYFKTGPGSGNTTVEDIVSLNAVESANALNVRYILTHTQSKGAPYLISRFKPDCWILSCGGDEKTNQFLTLSYGIHPVSLDYETNGLADMAMRFVGKAGMIEKDERVILVEDESTKDMHGTDSLKIISA